MQSFIPDGPSRSLFKDELNSAPSNLLITDVDDTLWNKREIFPEVEEFLHHAKTLGYQIYANSFNAKAPEILSQLGILKYFSGGICGRFDTEVKRLDHYKQDKGEMIVTLLKHIKYNSILPIYYFDDDPDQIKAVNHTSLKTVWRFTTIQVDKKEGICITHTKLLKAHKNPNNIPTTQEDCDQLVALSSSLDNATIVYKNWLINNIISSLRMDKSKML
jgi:hydroxymethylpyrimidine pyrophosphatase-like HAD family hydrolase